ncbi:MAG: ABC transporter ATP-binding protein [Candidatus Bathyarchaeota archaeon]|nr:ABC transporter ATP-binding protein [Candidatus Bathyarchaeota archaeon]MDH5419077.1 ABC transporter ATP-binding protein [Candidatus Bathyarchaeota archaeon]MDH5623670.1 ABC transporter ATP-binding protein [Candidatus Bathyarchaeota archaeon]MDH5635558.1 ABC transporter ATP-binding protein [Candidatus Bathyarchaeota archaeon]MDH5701806.1 ABC transporter ATP-binding protein [Candidatus Bathyarchaeota archaeon]
MSSQSVITVSNLTKFYGDFKALDSVSLAVEKGWVYGYLGPNGAGKTTTIRTMLGLLKPDQGEVQITGINPTKDPVQALQSLGYAPELPTLQTFFTGEQLLDFMGKIFGLATQARKERIKQLLDLVGLKEWGDKRIGNYSKGMVQRLSIALALINDPVVLIMDEPTIGMDPEATAHFRNLFTTLSKQGKTVFISSHLLDEVQRICTHVGMINKGRMVFDGRIAQVLETFTQQWVIEAELEEVTKTMVSSLKKLDCVEDVKVDGNKLRIELKEKKDLRGEISSEIFKRKGVLLSLNLHKITLEDAYLRALKGGQ